MTHRHVRPVDSRPFDHAGSSDHARGSLSFDVVYGCPFFFFTWQVFGMTDANHYPSWDLPPPQVRKDWINLPGTAP